MNSQQLLYYKVAQYFDASFLTSQSDSYNEL